MVLYQNGKLKFGIKRVMFLHILLYLCLYDKFHTTILQITKKKEVKEWILTDK